MSCDGLGAVKFLAQRPELTQHKGKPVQLFHNDLACVIEQVVIHVLGHCFSQKKVVVADDLYPSHSALDVDGAFSDQGGLDDARGHGGESCFLKLVHVPSRCAATEPDLLADGLVPLTFLSAYDRLNDAASAEGLAVDNPNHHP